MKLFCFAHSTTHNNDVSFCFDQFFLFKCLHIPVYISFFISIGVYKQGEQAISCFQGMAAKWIFCLSKCGSFSNKPNEQTMSEIVVSKSNKSGDAGPVESHPCHWLQWTFTYCTSHLTQIYQLDFVTTVHPFLAQRPNWQIHFNLFHLSHFIQHWGRNKASSLKVLCEKDLNESHNLGFIITKKNLGVQDVFGNTASSKQEK